MTYLLSKPKNLELLEYFSYANETSYGEDVSEQSDCAISITTSENRIKNIPKIRQQDMFIHLLTKMDNSWYCGSSKNQ